MEETAASVLFLCFVFLVFPGLQVVVVQSAQQPPPPRPTQVSPAIPLQ